MVTAEDITDEQIRELRDSAHDYGDGDPDFVVRICARALGEGHPKWLTPTERRGRTCNARVRCAEIWNARKERP